ncbi:alcohol oxidase [Thozetella sp. PMI_491]|nr:alcohol oxidase [Thozetella sp. PMI_491]
MYSSTLIISSLTIPNALVWVHGHGSDPHWGGDVFSSSFGIPNQDATYDYVVIGGGTAGNTIASLLARDKDISIAVVEAGGFAWEDMGNQTVIPAYCWRFEEFFNLNKTNPSVDFDLNTEPQANLGGRQEHYTCPKTFGGGSTLNDMGYHRVTKGTMDYWAQVVGDKSYKWDNFFQFYKKGTHYTPVEGVPDESRNFDREGGPLDITYAPYRQPQNKIMSRAFEKLGLDRILGFNGGSLNGYGFFTVYQDPKKHTRVSSATSYLLQGLEKTSGLVAYPRTLAQKILFQNGMASGVIVQTAGQNYTISARKEIIVSAGFIHSPQLLMVSGIGPAATLQKYGIEVVSNLPGVGANWQDQPYVFAAVQTSEQTGSATLLDPARLEKARREYLKDRTGPLSSPGYDIVGWEKLPSKYRAGLSSQAKAVLKTFPADWPDLELITAAIAAGNPQDPTNNQIFAFVAALLVHNSVGSINITSSSISDPPILKANMLTTTEDRELMLVAVKRLLELLDATGIVTGRLNPPASVETDVQLLEWINENVVYGYHGSSTCKMGKKGDPMAVVDSKARVFGVQKLRVLDASIIPFCVPGHPTGTIYALSEKIAHDILSAKGSTQNDEGVQNEEL